MKQIAKYSKACERLTFPHSNQEELYTELNRIGYFWDSKKKEWFRDDTPAKEVTDLVRVRVWAATSKVDQAAQLFIEAASDMNLKLLEQSPPYICRPPNQGESRIYLTFQDNDA